MDGRQHCMGMFFSASLQEEVLAFESAALRDEWISKLTVRVCMLCSRSLFHSMPLHIAQSFIHVAFSYPRPSVRAGHSSCGGLSTHGAADSPGLLLLALHTAVDNCATLLPRPDIFLFFIRFAGCCPRSRQRQTRHLRSSEKRGLASCSGPLDRRPFLRWPPRWRVSAVYIARRADHVMTLVFHEPKLCLLTYMFFSQMTPLMYSADIGHTDVCRLLLENAADVNARNCM